MSKKKRILRWVGGIVAVAILVPSVYLLITGEIGYFDLLKASRELDATLKESERLGLPMTAADLEPNPPVPDADNAALIVAPAVQNLPLISSSSTLLLSGADPERRAKLIQELSDHRATIRTVEHGLIRDQWYFSRNWDEGVLAVFPEYLKYKSTARLLSSEALQLALKDKPEEALSRFIAGRRLAKFCTSEPTMIGILVGIACDAIMLRAAENLTEVWASDNAKLERLANAVNSTRFTIDPRSMFRTEFYAALNFARNYEEFGGLKGIEALSSGAEWVKSGDTQIATDSTIPPDLSKLKKSGTPDDITARAIMNPICKIWNSVFKKWGKNAPRSGEWGPYIQAMSDDLRESKKASSMFASVFFPVFDQADLACVKQEWYPNLSLALIRALQYRNRTGHFPKSLAEINIDSADPLSGDSLRYIVDNDGIQIYSIGPDKVDNGGPLMRKNKPDIGVVFPSSRRNKTNE